MRNEIKKEKPPSNKEARSYIIGKFFKSYFKKFMYNISIGGMPLAQFCVRLHMGGENNNRYCTLPWQSPPILKRMELRNNFTRFFLLIELCEISISFTFS